MFRENTLCCTINYLRFSCSLACVMIKVEGNVERLKTEMEVAQG